MAVVGGANLNALQQPPKPSKNPTSLILTRAGYRKVPARLFSELASIATREIGYFPSIHPRSGHYQSSRSIPLICKERAR